MTEETGGSDGGQTTTTAPAPRRGGGAAAQAAAWAFVFLILRLFAVSGYDWDTAFAVSTTIGLTDGLRLVFGSLMAGHLVTAILLVAVVPLLVAAYLWGPSRHRPSVMLLTTLALVTLVALTTTYGTWWLPVATAALLAVFTLVGHLPPEHRLRRLAMAAMSKVIWVAGVAVLVVAAVVQTPWVPLEEIQTTNGNIAGYVLSVDSGFLNVLTDEHHFVIINSSDVLARGPGD